MKKPSIKQALLVLLPAAALVLECLPFSLVMRFMGDPSTGNVFLEYISYFDFLAVGYGNWGPMLTGVITCVLILLAAIHCFRTGGKRRKAIRNLAIAAFVFSLTPLAFQEMTVYGCFISALLLLEVLLAVWSKEA